MVPPAAAPTKEGAKKQTPSPIEPSKAPVASSAKQQVEVEEAEDKPMKAATASEGPTLKSMLTEGVTQEQIVYERLFAKSLPQRQRDSYFLTEMYNIRSLIRRQGDVDGSPDLRLKSASAKDDNAKLALKPYYTPTSPEDRTLVFESRFESGNLCMAIKVPPTMRQP